jgi:hypothetical protein
MKYYSVFAQAYGQSNYGECVYNDTTQCANSGGGSAGGSTGTGSTNGGGSAGNSGNSGGLANTGLELAIILTVACLLAFAALVVRIWRRKPAVQEADIEEADDADQRRLSGRY